MACAICTTRREKRHCPGIQGEICTVCCGSQREETIDCPPDCEYLQSARAHELPNNDPAGLPNREIYISDDFVQKNFPLIAMMQHALLEGAMSRNAVDFDAREAIGSLIRTYQTLGSGLYYESRPSNPIAGAIYDTVQRRVEEMRKEENERGIHKLQDSQLLTVFVFLQRLEYALNNQRKRGRAFIGSLIDSLSQMAGPPDQPAAPSSLIIA